MQGELQAQGAYVHGTCGPQVEGIHTMCRLTDWRFPQECMHLRDKPWDGSPGACHHYLHSLAALLVLEMLLASTMGAEGAGTWQ